MLVALRLGGLTEKAKLAKNVHFQKIRASVDKDSIRCSAAAKHPFAEDEDPVPRTDGTESLVFLHGLGQVSNIKY